ncbi:MAG: hypothetical protein AABY07_05190, partial [Nanoarchaeota archaeon]
MTVNIDIVPPIVFNSNISSPNSGTNNSGTIVFNVSVVDAITSVDTVFINITNNSNVQKGIITTTRQGTTNFYNASINTNNFSDGIYNITVFANDTLGNLNNTAKVSVIVFDNNPPAISFSCNDDNVRISDVITCTCTATDSVDSSPTIIYTANPSTVNTGTHTTTCTATDYVGNSDYKSIQYIVEGGGAGNSGGGGGGGSSGSGATSEKEIKWTTYPISNEAITKGHNIELKEKQRIQTNIENEDHFVGIISILKDSVIIEVLSTPQRAAINIGESKKFEISGDNLYDLSLALNSIKENKANITITGIHEAVPILEQQKEEEKEITGSPEIEEKKSTLKNLIPIIAHYPFTLTGFFILII